MTAYFVSKVGNDSNSGLDTTTNSLLTITAGVAKLTVSGDTLDILAGTYNERVQITKAGTQANPYIIRNYQNDAVVVDLNGITLLGTEAGIEVNQGSQWVNVQASEIGKIIVINSDEEGIALRNGSPFGGIENCKLLYLDVDGCGGSGISFFGEKQLNSVNCEIAYCRTRNTDKHGIQVRDPYGGFNHVHHNGVADWGQEFVGANWDAIAGHDSHHTVYERNIVTRTAGNTGDGIDVGGDELTVPTENHHTIVQHNTTVVATQGGGMKVNNDARRVLFRFNKLEGMTVGFYCPLYIDFCAYHNTLLNPLENISGGGQANQFWNEGGNPSAPETFQGMYFDNNVTQLDGSNSIYVWQHEPNGLTDVGILASGNVFRMDFLGSREVDWQTDTGLITDWATLSARPNFTNNTRVFEDIVDQNFNLLPAGPGVNGGVFPCTLTADAVNTNVITVNSNRYFVTAAEYNGLIDNDIVRVADSAAVEVTDVNETDGITMTLSGNVDGVIGDPVWFPWTGSAPDAGAVQFSPTGGQVILMGS